MAGKRKPEGGKKEQEPPAKKVSPSKQKGKREKEEEESKIESITTQGTEKPMTGANLEDVMQLETERTQEKEGQEEEEQKEVGEEEEKVSEEEEPHGWETSTAQWRNAMGMTPAAASRERAEESRKRQQRRLENAHRFTITMKTSVIGAEIEDRVKEVREALQKVLDITKRMEHAETWLIPTIGADNKKKQTTRGSRKNGQIQVG